MSLLPLVTVPDSRLRQKAAPVAAVDSRIQRLMDDMLETMYNDKGVGLAGPQVGVLERVIVMDVSDWDKSATREPIAMANPEVLWSSEETCPYTEGCLSIPGQFAEIIRPKRVKIGWLDRHGKRQEIEADDLLARCVQHEIDHLNGVLFIDYLTALKRNMLLRRLDKERRQKKF